MAVRTPSRRTLAFLVFFGLIATVIAAGLFRVRTGEVAVARAGDGGVARVWNDGWHWRLPFSGQLLRLPAEPIALEPEVEVRTAEGAAIVVRLDGRFGVRSGGADEWIAAGGWQPFVDGLVTVAGESLAARVRDADPASLFDAGAEQALAETLAEALAASGLEVAELAVSVPLDRNPVAAAIARNRVTRLGRPSGKKVLLIGWDGADWLMIRPLIEAGRMPNLERLIASGAAGDLLSQQPLLSPILWTTIATGKPATEHRIADFLMRDPETGNLVPVSSTARQVHALWTILPAFDLTTDVVAWWATWPAEPVLGTMVSDRVAYQLFYYEEDGGNEGKVHPPEAWPQVAEELTTAEEVGWEEVRRFIDVERDDFEARWAALPPERRQEDPVNHLRKILATTRSYHQIALSLLEQQADLTMVYYEGTDTVGHLFARYLPPRMEGVSAEEVARFGRALPEFYAYADELLGDLLAAIDDDTVVMLVSDHGFFTGEARPHSDPSDFAQGAPQWHRVTGVIAADGPGVRRGEIEAATIYDVTPTVLAVLGLPVPADMPGNALPAVVGSGGAPPAGGERLASYEQLPRERPEELTRVAAEEDEERLRELVALGYISADALDRDRGAESAAGDGGEAGTAARQASANLEGEATEAYNLGRMYITQGDFEAAREQLELALDRQPGFGLAWSSLAQIESIRGAHSRAFDLLAEGFSKSQTMPRFAITTLVDEATKAGRLPEAGTVLEAMGPVYRRDSAYHSALALLHEGTGRPDSALAHYGRALELDPLDQLATEQTLALLRSLGRTQETAAFADRAVARASGNVIAMNQLAVILLRQGFPAHAERLLRRVLESDPGNPGVLANLAAVQLRQGLREEALATMASAVDRDPTDARNQFNLGAMLAEQGRFAEALAAFTAARDHGLKTPPVYIAMAKMSFRLGDRAAAEQALRQALQIDPGQQEARAMLDALRTG